MMTQFAFGLGVPFTCVGQLALGTLQRHAADQFAGGLLQLALGNGPIPEMTALLAQASLQPIVAFPFLLRHAPIELRQLAFQLAAELEYLDGPFLLRAGERIPSESQLRPLSEQFRLALQFALGFPPQVKGACFRDPVRARAAARNPV